MAFEALRDRRIALDDLVPVSAHAASMEPSKLGLVPGTRLTVEQAILGLVTKSANDAAVGARRTAGRQRGPVRPDDDAARPRARHGAHHVPQRLRPAGSGPVDDGARPGDAGAPDLIRLPRRLPLFQHAQLHLPPAGDLQPRHHAEDLSGRRRHEDRLHRGVRPQPGHQRGARRGAADRRGAGRRHRTSSATSHMAALLDQGFGADGRADRARRHRRGKAWTDAKPAARPDRQCASRRAAARARLPPPRAPAALGHPGRHLRLGPRRAMPPPRSPAAVPMAARCISSRSS